MNISGLEAKRIDKKLDSFASFDSITKNNCFTARRKVFKIVDNERYSFRIRLSEADELGQSFWQK